MKTKTCNKCDEDRSLTLFKTHNRSKDGLLNSCTICEKSKKCKRCEKMQPMGKYKYCPNAARRRDRTCTDCHTEMETNPSKYSPKPEAIKAKKDKDKPYDTATAKAIMAVPIKPQSTHSYYMIDKYKQGQKEIRLR